jgi:hypothetical protein
MFECLPTYQYRIRQSARPGSPTTHAYLTRGQFNACETGRFLGYLHSIDRKCIEVLVACTKPDCDTRPGWMDLDYSEWIECEVCGRPMPPVTK